ncbi:MAG: hypothetical protein FD152_3160, partial [Xanthobacteraceae bacterium]
MSRAATATKMQFASAGAAGAVDDDLAAAFEAH